MQSCLQQDPSERAAWPTLLYGYLEEPSYVKLASKTLEDQLELSTSKVLAKEVSLELLSKEDLGLEFAKDSDEDLLQSTDPLQSIEALRQLIREEETELNLLQSDHNFVVESIECLKDS